MFLYVSSNNKWIVIQSSYYLNRFLLFMRTVWISNDNGCDD